MVALSFYIILIYKLRISFYFQLSKDIGRLTKDLDKVMSSMDLEKVSKIMSKFESQFEDLDVRTAVS
jgi:hypothetical protein